MMKALWSSILLVCLIATSVQAHYIIVGGKLYFHSIECSIDMTGILDPVNTNAKVECELSISKMEALCQSPKSMSMANTISAKTVSVSPNVIRSKTMNIESIHRTASGKATVVIPVVPSCTQSLPTDASCLVGLTSIVCESPDWKLIDVISRQVEATYKTYMCGEATCKTEKMELASIAVYSCVLPAKVTFSTDKSQAIPYECTKVSNTHVK